MTTGREFNERMQAEDLERRRERVGLLPAAEAVCPLCGHQWRRHDPADGRCDAHTGTPGRFDVCECGRDLGWMQKRIAALSSEALAR